MPGFTTRSGTKVIIEKDRFHTMNSETIGIDPNSALGYNIKDVEYAMRLTYSGEFLHAAPWSVASQGHENVSHGCTGMSTANAGWLYDHSQIGDVVEYTGSNVHMTLDNGYGDWNESFAHLRPRLRPPLTPSRRKQAVAHHAESAQTGTRNRAESASRRLGERRSVHRRSGELIGYDVARGIPAPWTSPTTPLPDLGSARPDRSALHDELGAGPRLDPRRLRAWVRAGLLVAPVHGVLHAAQLPDCLDLRLACLRLVVPEHAVVTDRTAAWLHGAPMVLEPARPSSVPRGRHVPPARGPHPPVRCRSGQRELFASRDRGARAGSE